MSSVSSRTRAHEADTEVDWEWITHVLMCRSGGRCECCGERIRPETRYVRHHRLLRSAGGRDEIPNLLLLIDEHHRVRVHDEPAAATSRGLILLRGALPYTSPLTTYGGRRVYLDPSGLYVPTETP